MGRKKNERRTVLVDHQLQARIVLSTSLPMIACLAFAVAVEVFVRRQLDAGAVPSDSTIVGVPVQRIGMLLLFVSAAMTQLVSALLASQKVAGTSYRIRQVLTDFRRGDVTERVRLRKGDFQVRLADDINEFLEWVAAGSVRPVVPARGEAAGTGGVDNEGSAPGRNAIASPATANPVVRPERRTATSTETPS